MPEATAAVQSADDAYFVLGLQPKNMMLQIDPAEVKDGRVVRIIQALPLHEFGQSQGDFVVGKVKGGATYVVHSASLMAGHSIFGRLYYPCGRTLAFTVPAGKVVYVTNISYLFNGNGMGSSQRADFAGAHDFLALHYPGLVDKLEQGSFQNVQFASGHC